MATKKRSGPSAKGGRHRTVHDNREHVYEKLKKTLGAGLAARIANAGRTRAGRSRMAKKAARTRKRRGR